ncbi:MAG: hypothetical protein WC718_14950 [Phycisphaerales bacterium]|jgi:hypothetical protein
MSGGEGTYKLYPQPEQELPVDRPACKHRWWEGDAAHPFCLDCGEDKEVIELRADYAKAITLLGEVGLLHAIAGVHKHKMFAAWGRERDRLLRTPRAQSILDASAKRLGLTPPIRPTAKGVQP